MPEYQSWQEIYQSHQFDMPLERWQSIIGKGADDGAFDPYDHLETLIGAPIDREAVRSARKKRMMEMIEAQAALPGVTTYITDAKTLGLKVGVASSSGCDWVKGHLTRMGMIDQFDCIRCADDVTNTKPDPELYLAVLKAFDLQPSEAIAFEDSANGALAAKRAGLFCVAVPNAMTQSMNFDHVDMRLKSLADLPLRELIRDR